MKKSNLILLFLLSFADSIFAQSHNSAMQIWLRDNKLLTVVMDGRHYRRFGRTITFVDLPSGMHEVKVYRFYPNDDPRYSNFDDNRAHAKLIYKGRMRIDPATMYYCTVDPQYKTMSIRESRNIAFDNTDKTYLIDENPIFSENSEQDDYEWTKRRREDTENSNTDKRTSNLLTSTQMSTLKNSVEDRIGSKDKINLIQEYLSDKKMSTEQVGSILSWLSFESDKLQIAKYCYPKVIDQDNYLEISNLLSFQSSKRELDAVIFDTKNKKGDDNTKPMDTKLQQSQIEQLSASLKDKITDTEKQKLMQQQLSGKTMTVAQIATMLDWFTFEGSKLEFTKWAYNRVSDRQNYSQLKSKFSFSSSKKAIDDLIAKGK
jgi:hypothetical protein